MPRYLKYFEKKIQNMFLHFECKSSLEIEAMCDARVLKITCISKISGIQWVGKGLYYKESEA